VTVGRKAGLTRESRALGVQAPAGASISALSLRLITLDAVKSRNETAGNEQD
jgi:hypothetical protein